MLGRLERGERGLERLPRRVRDARVVVALVLADRVLDVRRRLVDRRDDRAGRGIRLLADVDCARLEVHAPESRRGPRPESGARAAGRGRCGPSRRCGRVPAGSRTRRAAARRRPRATCSASSSAATIRTGASMRGKRRHASQPAKSSQRPGEHLVVRLAEVIEQPRPVDGSSRAGTRRPSARTRSAVSCHSAGSASGAVDAARQPRGRPRARGAAAGELVPDDRLPSSSPRRRSGRGPSESMTSITSPARSAAVYESAGGVFPRPRWSTSTTLMVGQTVGIAGHPPHPQVAARRPCGGRAESLQPASSKWITELGAEEPAPSSRAACRA